MKPNILCNNKLTDVYRREGITFLGVFGSFARGEDTADSDIDLIVRFSRTKSLLELVRIERDLSSLLGRKVDLLTEAAISPYLKDRIMSEMETVYEQ